MNWKSTCRSVVWALSATAMLTSCSDQGIVGGEWNGVTRIEVTPADLQLNAGEAKPLALRALDSSGQPVEFASTDGFNIVWRSSDTTVAKVEGSGTGVQVRGIGAGTARITVTVTPEGSQMRLSTSAEVVTLAAAVSAQAASGDDQTGVVGQVLPENLAVRIVDEDGEGVAGVTVNFATANDGKLNPASASTDDSGVARTAWQLGPRAGAQRVTASAAGGASVTFDATARAASPDTIRIQAGTGQTGLVGEPLPDTLVVRLSDGFGNPVPNTAVSWAIVSGGGTVTPVSPNTNSAGLARAIWQLGTETGTQRLRASSGNLVTEFAADASTTPPPNNPDPVPVAPATVTDLRVVSATENSVTLSWTAVSDGDDGSASYAIRTGTPTLSWGAAYESERTIAPGKVGEAVTYTYTGLAAGTTYQFQLISYRGTLNEDAVFGARSSVVTRATSAPAVASVTLTPSSTTLTELGQTQQLVATARDASGRTLSGISFDWSSSNSSIVSVDNMGRITARAAGTALVIACAAGCDAADTTSVDVDPNVSTPSVASITATPASYTFTALGETRQITATALDAGGDAISNVQFSWTSSNSSVVSVDNSGRMTARGAGTARVIVGAGGVADTVNATVTISEPPPSGGDASYPNRPTGMTLIGRNDGSVKSSGGHAFGIDGFGEWFDHNVASDIAVVNDASNPTGSGRSLRFTYPSNDSKAGSANADHFSGGPYREVYVLMRINLEQSGWDTFGNKFFYVGAQSGQRHNTSSPTQFYTDRPGGSSLRIVNQNGQSAVATRADNVLPQGRWLTLEFLFTGESSEGAGNGRARMWVNGQEVSSTDSARWGATAFDGMQWYGEVNDIPVTSYYRLGELYIAGRK